MKKLILPLVTAALLLTLAGCVSYGDYRKEQEAKDTARLLAGLFAVGAVVFLSSSMADYITGQTLFIDGGMLVNTLKQ
jgi:NAD(P)-dependent dehydrogenase (short-subunit alcohol dehydrogenase family)